MGQGKNDQLIVQNRKWSIKQPGRFKRGAYTKAIYRRDLFLYREVS